MSKIIDFEKEKNLRNMKTGGNNVIEIYVSERKIYGLGISNKQKEIQVKSRKAKILTFPSYDKKEI